jgi:hypothetical protein
MTASRFEVITTAPIARPKASGRRWNPLALAAGVGLIGAAGALSWVSSRQVEAAAAELDERALVQAETALERSIEQDRRYVLSMVGLLADDTRVRTPLMMPKFDEATVRDVLDDLKRVSGATMLAVLDVNGRVRAVSGAPTLRDVDLGAAPVTRSALKQASADVWTLPQGALVTGVAAVRSANQALALLAVGFDIRGEEFAAIEHGLGVAGALLVGGRVVTGSTTDPHVVKAFEAAGALDEGGGRVVEGGEGFVVRIGHTGSGAGTGKLVWLRKDHQEIGRGRQVRLMHWLPVALVALTFVLGLTFTRRAGAQA